MRARSTIASSAALIAAFALQTSVAVAAPALWETLAPLREKWRNHTIDDARYRSAVLAATKSRKTAALWQAGLALGKTPTVAGKLRVREDDKPVEYVTAWSAITARHPKLLVQPPMQCALGCCDYPLERPAHRVVVTRACFDKQGAVTDLDLDTAIDTAAERLANQQGTDDDREHRVIEVELDAAHWLADPGKVAWANAVKNGYANQDERERAMRDAVKDRAGIALWDAAAAVTKTTPATTTNIAVRVVRNHKRPVATTVASFDAMTKLFAPKLDVPIACYADCCYFGTKAPPEKSLQVTDVCFDAERRPKSVTLTDSASFVEFGAWLLERVQLAARRSNWDPSSRADACLPLAAGNTELASVLYCARRLDPKLPDAAKKTERLWLALDDRMAAEADDDASFAEYWVSRAKSPFEKIVRQSSVKPLAKLSPDGVSVWDTTGREATRWPQRWHAANVDAIRTKYERKRRGDDRGSRLLEGKPEECRNACCTLKEPRTPCNVGGAYPDSYFVERACFDADGALTDLWIGADRYDDVDDHDLDLP